MEKFTKKLETKRKTRKEHFEQKGVTNTFCKDKQRYGEFDLFFVFLFFHRDLSK